MVSHIKDLKHDIIAGFSVFLLALPLCLGIAMASQFPPMAGVLTAVVGGLLGGCLGGARLSIKGPAAGLIVIVVSAVSQLGAGDLHLGYQRTLAVGVVAALIQILIGWRKKAVFAEVMPPAVIHGMLAAIGVIIIAKQSYVMLGTPLPQGSPVTQLMLLPIHLFQANPLILSLSLVALCIVLYWSQVQKLAVIPASLVMLLVIIPLSLYLDLSSEHPYSFAGIVYSAGPRFLINLPANFWEVLQFPDFSVVFSPLSLKYILMFALVGSIESLLTVSAIDSFSKHSDQPSDLNRDLKAVGIANLVSAFLGGLPMISEIVRSKANIDYGAKSAKANFFHGLFMLIAVLFAIPLINLIPLSSLAALLVVVGFRLASPREFIHVYKIGRDQFALFLVTFFITLFTDLLLGVAFGVLLKLMIHVFRGNSIKKIFNPVMRLETNSEGTKIYVEGPLTFVSYLTLKRLIVKTATESKSIIINFNEVTYLDHTVMKKLQTLNKELPGIAITLEINTALVPFYNHPLSARGK